MTDTGPEFGFGLYVHWPYCTRICPYCDFNVYAAKARDTAPLFNALLRDLTAHRERLPDHPAFQSVFFGGGTPSLMSAQQLARLTTAAKETFGLAPNAEISLEANPHDVLTADLAAWQAAGINRLSLGVQSLRDDALKFLGRDHSVREALEAISLALGVFPSVSIDLIYARPGQTDSEWKAELEQALDLGVHHLSLYELTIESRTAFGKAATRGDLIPMDDDDQADLYEMTQTVTAKVGYPAYEVSNHAISERHQSRHNMIYWQSGDWIGLGPGAHGRLTVGEERIATEAPLKPSDYVDGIPANEQVLCRRDVARETLAMGLRPHKGIALSRIQGLNTDQLAQLQADGLIAISREQRLHTTSRGRLLTDAITAQLSP